MNENLRVTPSLAIEYIYCPRFIYFMKVLDIPQNEEQRYKVLKGREIHNLKSLNDKDYLRKRINVKKKLINVELHSDEYKISGIVDEILFLDNGEIVPLDYKFSKYEGKIYKTSKLQMAMYAMLIQENYGLEVKRAYMVYTRSSNRLEELVFKEKDFLEVGEVVEKILKIIKKNYYPNSTSVKKRCIDCCYKNICIK